MTDTRKTIATLNSARVQLDDQIQDAEAELNRREIHVDDGTTPVEAVWSSLQTLRHNDRYEAQIDSLRQFRWHLSLVQAASQADPLTS